MIYLLVDTGKTPAKVLHYVVENVVEDKMKAEHWRQLLEEQGKDITIVEFDTETFDELAEKFAK
jgi:hypothetical protein